ncbi:MAG: aminotransferase class I/II-fold pyridoxal phosphate-dependent enzyme [Gammaproteobacteria bacterium]|nr:aminotransferase class I/II-fold pyridoxal phosphate-dependent enzyme [Gammaproteobacteria bacterium]
MLGSADLIRPMLEKTRDSYNVDAISQALGRAAIGDRPYAADTWRQVRAARQSLAAGLTRLGFMVEPSQTNFLLARVAGQAPRSAQELYAYLKNQRILVRHFPTPRLDDCLRISVGTPTQNQRLIAALGEALHD